MKQKENKRVTWMTTIVGAVLAILSLSLIFYENSGDTAEETQHTSAAEGPYYEPGARPPTSVQTGGTTDNGVTYGGTAWGGLQVGYVGKNKIIQDSSEVYIPRLGNDKFGLVETNVTVKRLDQNGNVMQTLTGKALVFANARDSADAGYVMVHQSEAPNWVAVLNGNPDYVFNSSKSNIYPYTIELPRTGQTLTAYNLADLANASGGAGDPPPGDGLTKIRDDLYLKRDGFIATPRPSAGISIGLAGTTAGSLSTTSMASISTATNSSDIPPGLQPKYIDQSGMEFAKVEELLLLFARIDEVSGDQLLPMVIHRSSNLIYAVTKLDKATATITVGDQIGEVTRTEGMHIYFQLEIFPEVKGKELSVEVQR